MSDTDDRYRSRKFIVAACSLVVVSCLAGWGMLVHATDAAGAALVIGAWGASDAAILKLYNDANIDDGDSK